ncbi:MAG: Phosphocarrier protein HPr [Syntrophus sp. SKADARSKE-3]|nr:Phosphocarrier protein HPr [Syntrophus sp. SKADARSKE-3]
MLKTGSFQVNNRLGIHARVAAKLVYTANRFKSKVILEYNGQEVNGKSILGILTLSCPKGSYITVRADGSDAEDVLLAFAALFDEKFGEEWR